MFALSVSKLARLSAVALVATVVAVAPLSAQAGAKTKPDTAKKMDHGSMAGMDHGKMEGEHAKGSGWKELDAYHTLLAASFHPTQKGDFAPARAKAPELALAAKKWAEAKAPAGCDSPETKKAIADVQSGSAAFADVVARKGPDELVKASITAVHDRFEKVEGSCKPTAGPK